MMSMMNSAMINGVADLKNEKLGTKEAASPPGLMVPSIKSEQVTKPSTETANLVPTLLLELVTIATQIAQLDAMFVNVDKNAPEPDSDAHKWHQVSVQALNTSRKYMCEQQMSLMKRLAKVTGAQLPEQSCNVAPAPPKEDTTEAKPALAPPPGLDMLQQDEQVSIANPQSGSPKPSVHGDHGSLRNDLEKIRSYGPGCALLVRKIKAFGFDSAEHLRTHFQQFGEVSEVLVSHCITKPNAKRVNGRVRPAALGVVVMASAADVGKVLAFGAEHSIPLQESTVTVEVTPFRDTSDDCVSSD